MAAFNSRVRDILLATLTSILVGWLRPYQQRWIQDRSRYKVGLMSRQVGKSEVISLEATLLSLEKPKSPEQVVLLVSSGDFQAKELLRKVTRWTDLLDEVLKRAFGPRASIYLKPPTSECLHMISGQRIISHPASPRTLAGFTGSVFWDEAGRTPYDELVYEALFPITDEGEYPIRITGTPWGDTGIFHDICTCGPAGGPKSNWSMHKTTIVDAVRMGLRRDIELIKSMFDPFTFAQDYMCEFVSAANQVFDKDLILSCLDLELPPTDFTNRNIRRGLGVDIGRTHDKTAELWAAEYPDSFYQVERVQILRNLPFNEQEAIIGSELRSGRILKSRIDKTGLGMQMAENLERMYPGIAEGVAFTPKIKEEMVALVLSLAQSKRLKLIPDSDLISDMSAIRRQYSHKGGGVLYDAARTEKGHADSFWALGLALSGLTQASDWRIGAIGDGSARPAEAVPMIGQSEPAEGSIMRMLNKYAMDSELPTTDDMGLDPFLEGGGDMGDDGYELRY